MRLRIIKSNVKYSYKIFLNGVIVKNFSELFNKNIFDIIKGLFNNKTDVLRIDIYYNKHFKVGSVILEF